VGGFGECAQRGLFKRVVKRQGDKITRRMKEKKQREEM
jgi:coenzyme F420-reducing hydrogenase gamma subunit